MLQSNNRTWPLIQSFFQCSEVGDSFTPKELKNYLCNFHPTTASVYLKGLRKNGYIKRVDHGVYQIVHPIDNSLYLNLTTLTMQDKYSAITPSAVRPTFGPPMRGYA